MACTQKCQLVRFPKSRVQKQWFRYFNDHKDFQNEGTLHLFSLMALYSYACFRPHVRQIGDQKYMEGPGQWICKLSALPRILRVHHKAQARELMAYFRDAGFLDFEVLDEEKELIRFSIRDWQRHCVHLEYNYYSYKGSGFFFFPLPVGRQLIRASRSRGKVQFSELDAIMDLWLHTILNDQTVKGSEYPGVDERLYIVKDITSLPAADVAPVRHGDGRNTMAPIKGSTTVPSAKGKLSITRKMER